MNNVDRYIPIALKALKNVMLIDEEKETRFLNDNAIAKVYNGYISSLGANIIQAGVKTAVYFFEAKESNSDGDKRLINAAINYIIFNTGNDDVIFSDYQLSKKLPVAPHELQLFTQKIMDAATALKLAIRTYKLK